jgi:hypothetical protein
MRIKLQPTIKGLCVRCRNGHVTEDSAGHVEVWCNLLMEPKRMGRAVLRCTDFNERGRDDEHEMRRIAWTLDVNKRGEMGFRPPKKDDV